MRTTIPAPLHGAGLAAELAAAGVAFSDLWVEGDELVVDGVTDETAALSVVEAHTGSPPPAEVERDQREFVLLQAVPTLRQWADDAAGVTVNNGNNNNVTQTVVNRLGVFFDRFADLLEHQYR